MGTEVEVQFGKSLQVSTLLSHKQVMVQVQAMADSCTDMVFGKLVQVCFTSMAYFCIWGHNLATSGVSRDSIHSAKARQCMIKHRISGCMRVTCVVAGYNGA